MKKLYFTHEEKLRAVRERLRSRRPDVSLKEKFIDKDTVSGCWEWLGQKWDSGYGYVRVLGKITSAHRYMYERLVSKIPPGLDLLHSCDNPGCVNPDHLTPGTHTDNMRDMWAKGRGPNFKGINNPNYKHGRRTRDIINYD